MASAVEQHGQQAIDHRSASDDIHGPHSQLVGAVSGIASIWKPTPPQRMH